MIGENPRTDKLVLHFVGGNALERARFAKDVSMNFETPNEHRKPVLHYVNAEVRPRAEFAQMAISMGLHCEVYESLADIFAYPPRHGIMVVNDEPAIGGGIVAALAELERRGVWLPVIAVGTMPNPSRIVDAIKAGALDYLTTPVDQARLERSLKRTEAEAERTSTVRRNRVLAQQKLENLSGRESQVLELLAEGFSNKQIARELEISPRTVEIHRANMMAKLGTSHATSAVRLKLEASSFWAA